MEDSPTLPHHPYPPKGRSASTPNDSEGRRSRAQSSSRNKSQPNISLSPDTSRSQGLPFPPSSHVITKSTSSATTQLPPAQDDFEARSLFAPVSPRDGGPGTVLQRMDTIVPGPFHLGSKVDFQQPRHKRASSSKDFTYPAIPRASLSHSQRPSTSGSAAAKKPSQSGISAHDLPPLLTNPRRPSTSGSISQRPSTSGSAAAKNPSQSGISAHDLPPLLTNPRRPSTSGSMSQRPSNSRSATAKKPSQSGISAHDLPPLLTNPRRPSTSGSMSARRPSFSSFHASRQDPDGSIGPSVPSIPSHLRSLNRAPSIEKPDQEDASRRFPSDISSNSEKASNPFLHITKPSVSSKSASLLPGPTEVQNHSRVGPSRNIDSDHHTHTPTESLTSNYSSGSDGRSSSSASTPPQADSPQRQRRVLHDRDRIGSLNTEFSFTKERSTAIRKAALPHRIVPPEFNRNMTARSLNSSASPEGATPDSGSGTSAALSAHKLVTSPDSYFKLPSPSTSNNLQSSSFPLPNTAPAPYSRQPKKPSKGNCRGCGELIHGKSVSSADGRLTGRYHKQCFVCSTCKDPFQTADFYILEDQPYCARHYHLLNNSICTGCDVGIEGQYLETELKQKFHPKCFTCQVGYFVKGK